MTILNSRALLTAVVAALPAVMVLGAASTARAQYQVGSNGHALDANNRVGGGGFNGGVGNNSGPGGGINNNIVTGNVSGLSYFHGRNNGEFDPNTFNGRTGSSSFDRFNAISAPVNYAAPETGTSAYVPFYSTGNIVGQSLPGYMNTPGNTGVVPVPTMNPLTPTGFDDRINQVNADPTQGNLLTTGELNIGGPVDPSTGDQSMYSMSPLYGIRQNDASGLQQDSIYNTRTSSANAANRAVMTPGQIQEMRDELNKTVIPSNLPARITQPGQPSQSGAGQPVQSSPAARPDDTQTPSPGSMASGQPLSSPAITSTNLGSDQSLTSSALTNSPVGGDLNNGEGLQNTLIAPAKQSKQLADLEKKFAQDKQKPTDVEAAQRFNEELKLEKSASATKGNTTATPKPAVTGTGIPQGGDTDIKPDNTAQVPAAKPILTAPDAGQINQPYIVTSLATGIEAKGLGALMKGAEDKMRQGKFTEAVDTYDTAEQVAPNNPLISLGRCFAELGASYYGKADLDLNRAVMLDPAILAGRYDLHGFLGEDRARFVHDDLQDIADHEKSARPLVLLGFIAHNNGDDKLTKRDLDEAGHRGGYARLLKQMKEAWSLK